MKILLFMLLPFAVIGQNCTYLDPTFVIGGATQIQGGCTPGTIEVKDMGNIQVFRTGGQRLALPSWNSPNGRWIYFWRIGGQLYGHSSTCSAEVVVSPPLPYGTQVTCQPIWVVDNDNEPKIKVMSNTYASVIVGSSRTPVKPSRQELGVMKIILE